MATAVSRTKEESDGSYVYIHLHKQLADLSDADVLTDFPCDFDGTVEALRVIVSTAATTAAKACTLTVQIDSTSVTGTATALTSANMTPLGAIVSGNATANNEFRSGQTLSIVGSSTTTFIEGRVVVVLVLKRKG